MREPNGWTRAKLRRLENKYRQEMKKHIAGQPSSWFHLDGEDLPMSFVPYLITHLRDVLENKIK